MLKVTCFWTVYYDVLVDLQNIDGKYKNFITINEIKITHLNWKKKLLLKFDNDGADTGNIDEVFCSAISLGLSVSANGFKLTLMSKKGT